MAGLSRNLFSLEPSDYHREEPLHDCPMVEDWLKSFVSPNALEDHVTSTSTVIEVQYVMEDEGAELVLLTTGDIDGGRTTREVRRTRSL